MIAILMNDDYNSTVNLEGFIQVYNHSDYDGNFFIEIYYGDGKKISLNYNFSDKNERRRDKDYQRIQKMLKSVSKHIDV